MSEHGFKVFEASDHLLDTGNCMVGSSFANVMCVDWFFAGIKIRGSKDNYNTITIVYFFYVDARGYNFSITLSKTLLVSLIFKSERATILVVFKKSALH